MATGSQKVALTGIVGAGSPKVHHTGEMAPPTTTTGTDTTPVVTETYLARVWIPTNTTLTGIALLNGSAAAGNVTVGLSDSTGVVLAKSASTAQSGTAAYQQIPFALATDVKGPGVYFVLVQFDSTSARFRSHILGNFAAGKLTGQTYGTMPSFTVPTTFTTNLGPIADTY